MSTPSAACSCPRKSFTDGGEWSPSRLGLKCGRSAKPSYMMISMLGGASTAVARTRAVLVELARRLPEIARIRMYFSLSACHCFLIRREHRLLKPYRTLITSGAVGIHPGCLPEWRGARLISSAWRREKLREEYTKTLSA